MKATLWFRTASGLLLLFAAGHTFGFLRFKGTTAESMAVRASMDAVHFPAKAGGAATYSFGGFFVGFGLFVSLFLILSAWLAWRLGSMATHDNRKTDIAPLGWALTIFMLVSAVLSMYYFSAPPVALSMAIAICLALGTMRTR